MAMRLWQVRRHWDLFARTDPLWAVLAEPDKKGNRWVLDEFFAVGEREIDVALAAIRARLPELPLRRALDFGCGVGRLSQGLARHFEHVTGVDISTEMLAHANRHNRHGDRVTYVHNTAPDLAQFADDSFDLVLSLITLQHIAPEYSRRYIAEFLRICAPGGAVYFQMTDMRTGPARFSWYPPTIAKKLWRRLNTFLAWQPAMEMHTLPRHEVEAIIQAAGGELIFVNDQHAAGQSFESCIYLARKR